MNNSLVQFIHIDTKANFLSKKKSINKNNSQYVYTKSGKDVIETGLPDILWGNICFIDETSEIYLNGRYYTTKYNIGNNVIIGDSVNLTLTLYEYILGTDYYASVRLPKGFCVSSGIQLGKENNYIRIYDSGYTGAYLGNNSSIGECVYIKLKEEINNNKSKFYIDLKDSSAFPLQSVLLGRDSKLDEYIKITEDSSIGQINIEGKNGSTNIKFRGNISIGFSNGNSLGEICIKNPSTYNIHTLNLGTNVILNSNVNLGTNIKIGYNTNIDHDVNLGVSSKLNDYAAIGKNVSINENTIIGKNVSIAEYTKIRGNVAIYDNVTIYGVVDIGSNVKIHDNILLKTINYYDTATRSAWSYLELNDASYFLKDPTSLGMGVKIDPYIQILNNFCSSTDFNTSNIDNKGILIVGTDTHYNNNREILPIYIGGNTTIGKNTKIIDNTDSDSDAGYYFGNDDVTSYIGNKVYVWPNVWLGTATNIDEHVSIDEYVSIGRYAALKYDADFPGIKMGKNTTDFDDDINTISIGCGSTIGQNVNIPDGFKIVYITAEQYASLDEKDNDTLYFIIENS